MENYSLRVTQCINATRDTKILYSASYFAVDLYSLITKVVLVHFTSSGMQFTNLAFAAAVVTINHSHLISKNVDCFKWFLDYQNSKAFDQKIAFREKV